MLISINDIDHQILANLFQRAKQLKQFGFQKTLSNKIIATLFFEPSTRTKMSFETAILKTGADILPFPIENSSLKKGETLEDTIKMISFYADLIILRHSEENSAFKAQQVSSCPIINAGDGKNEHPTQTLLDLFTIQEHHHSLEDFTITLAGDLKHSRTIHSLIMGLMNFTNAKIILASPEALSLSETYQKIIGDRLIYQTTSLNEGLQSDFIYMTRVQKERFSDSEGMHYEKEWILTLDTCKKFAKPHSKILHPLPRVNEINTDIDNSEYQLYFEQAKNGLYVRTALLEYILGVNHEY